MKIVLATTNRHKVAEIQKILSLPGIQIVEAPSAVRVHENGATFESNAVKKAKAYAKRFRTWALADDSGIEIDALGGRPGVRSARYAGPNPTREKLCGKALRELKDVPASRRGAQFVCVMALSDPAGKTWTKRGIVRGRIIHEMKGEHGFGYDPIFRPTGFARTFADLSPRTKNRLSHRGRALKKMAPLIRKLSTHRSSITSSKRKPS